ncbi:Undecaprenyl-phosphate galactose phosphotransferase WbaP/exopolysaccharide biosynthesis polyprenyl glycosylphosphotransferase [Kineothrix alysoides]|uniref:Undecaprenyl-phosphate galactose phosphotransferase WbaP/exopolysaccharide biosynthesis polyprenyl glycosylphosphotransferase n=1 Tax=Kineothrix alysoides TaxID=1469948 RepID=A0A4R1R214_9FIRM|nr:sugar transferase [Kineothrix alysoides]TCL59403.1 Undecaprenyl-phosphate galactose phosphotransferase WbaP/exopolysaccharide biosynthesis polyprenyl glycosylphosphotransferase [Kineothrix alysoides]
MKQKNKIIEVYGLWFVDLICIVISFVAATYIRFGNFKDMGDQSIHFLVCLCLMLFGTVYNFFIDWNRNFLRRSIWKEAYRVLQYNAIMILVVTFLMVLVKWADVFSRLVLAYFFVLNFFLCLAVHMAIKKFLYTYYASEQNSVKVMVITESSQIDFTLDRLEKELDIYYQIVALACMDDDLRGKEIRGIPVVAGKEGLIEVATQMALDEAFLSLPDISRKKLEQIIRGFGDMGVNCHYNLELPGMEANRSKVDSFGNYTVITYTRFQSSYKRMMIKRWMDIAGGFMGMLITLICLPFVALAIKLDSSGPVLFSQVRIGRNGRRFKIYKFRSMYMDAEERKKELEAENEMQGLMFKIENDPRITKVGAFLRKTSIDELPQFYNVFKGDMSLVGTRPPTQDEFEKYNQYYRRRISMTPGLTGMWQVSGRSNIEDFDDVVKYDLEYIDNWSLRLDIKILFQTIGVVLFGKGAK